MDGKTKGRSWISGAGTPLEVTNLKYPSSVQCNSSRINPNKGTFDNFSYDPAFEQYNAPDFGSNLSIHDVNDFDGGKERDGVKKRIGDYRSYSAKKSDFPNMTNNVISLPVTLDPDLPASIVEKIKATECEICNVKMTSFVHSKSHYEGRPHAKRVNVAKRKLDPTNSEELHKKKKKKTEFKVAIEGLYCKCCNLCFTSQSHATQHYLGRNHQRVLHGLKPLDVGYFNAQSGKWQREPIDPKIAAELIKREDNSLKGSGKFLCLICKVVTTCQEQLDMHLKGKGHAKKIKTVPIEKFSCEICGNENIEKKQYDKHLAGKEHAKRLKIAGHPVENETPSLAQCSSSTSDEVNEMPSNTVGSFVTDGTSNKLDDYEKFKTPQGTFHCSSCDVTLPSEHRLAAHLATRGHKQKDEAVL